MIRDQYNLYISNISDKTDEDRLISYFSQFGKIESHTYFKKSSRRHCAAAIITYGLSTDIDHIIHHNQRLQFDDRSLFLRRTLPLTRPAFERFMSSNELLLSLPFPSDDKQFNEINIRKYFSKYGSIVSCRIVIPHTTFLIDFVDSNSVDCAILDEPHFYNEKELILRKYISPNRAGMFRSKKDQRNLDDKTAKFPLWEQRRRLKDFLEAIQLGQKVELRLIKCSYEEKKLKFTRIQNDQMMTFSGDLRQQIHQLNDDIQQMKENNSSLRLLIERNQRIRKYMMEIYKDKIDNEQKRMKQLREAIDFLKLC